MPPHHHTILMPMIAWILNRFSFVWHLGRRADVVGLQIPVANISHRGTSDGLLRMRCVWLNRLPIAFKVIRWCRNRFPRKALECRMNKTFRVIYYLSKTRWTTFPARREIFFNMHGRSTALPSMNSRDEDWRLKVIYRVCSDNDVCWLSQKIVRSRSLWVSKLWATSFPLDIISKKSLQASIVTTLRIPIIMAIPMTLLS